MEIKELFDKECEPLDNALSEHLKEGKKRKEVLEHLQQKLRSLAEKEDILQNEVLYFLSQEKKTRKQKQKKLEESVKKGSLFYLNLKILMWFSQISHFFKLSILILFVLNSFIMGQIKALFIKILLIHLMVIIHPELLCFVSKFST